MTDKVHTAKPSTKRYYTIRGIEIETVDVVRETEKTYTYVYKSSRPVSSDLKIRVPVWVEQRATKPDTFSRDLEVVRAKAIEFTLSRIQFAKARLLHAEETLEKNRNFVDTPELYVGKIVMFDTYAWMIVEMDEEGDSYVLADSSEDADHPDGKGFAWTTGATKSEITVPTDAVAQIEMERMQKLCAISNLKYGDKTLDDIVEAPF